MPIDVQHEKQMLEGVNGGNLDHRVWLFSKGVEAQIDIFSQTVPHCQDEQGRWMPLDYFMGTGNKRSSHTMRSLPTHEVRRELHEQYAAIVREAVPQEYREPFLAGLRERLPVYDG